MAEFLIIFAILVVVVALVTAPLRQAADGRPDGEAATRARARAEGEIAELEAAREAKYREIRDAQLDHQTGKLSDEDFAQIDGALRQEALAILDALERAGAAVESAPLTAASEPATGASMSER